MWLIPLSLMPLLGKEDRAQRRAHWVRVGIAEDDVHGNRLARRAAVGEVDCDRLPRMGPLLDTVPRPRAGADLRVSLTDRLQPAVHLPYNRQGLDWLPGDDLLP